MARESDRALPLSREEQEVLRALVNRVQRSREQQGPFTLTVFPNHDEVELFFSREGQVDSESDNEVVFELYKELRQILEQAARINQKSERLRKITEENSNRIEKLEENNNKFSKQGGFTPKL